MKDYCDRCDKMSELEQDYDTGRYLCSKCMNRMMASFEADMRRDAEFREQVRNNPDAYDYGVHMEYQV